MKLMEACVHQDHIALQAPAMQGDICVLEAHIIHTTGPLVSHIVSHVVEGSPVHYLD